MTKNEILLPDEEIVELYWARDEKAIRSTDHKYGKYLFTVSYNILGNDQDAEECQNDTYLRTWNAIPPNRPNFFQLFLTKIIRHLSIDRYREQSSLRRVPSEMTKALDDYAGVLTDGMSAEDQYDARAIGELMSKFLLGQSETDQIIFVYRYYFGDSIQSLANQFSVSRRTISNHLSSMRNELRAILEKEGYTV